MVGFFYEYDSLTWIRLWVPSQAETVITNVYLYYKYFHKMITTFTQNGPKVGEFFQQANKWIPLYYYDTSSWLVFVCFLEEIEDTKKTFWN